MMSDAQPPPAKEGSGGGGSRPIRSGGAWEAVVDRAAWEVTAYLAATVKPFDPAGPLSQHMLALLDRSTLLDILKERNYNRLCGRPGCAELPSGLQKGGEAAACAVDFSRWRSTTHRDDDDDDDDDSCGVGEAEDRGRDAAALSSSSLPSDVDIGVTEERRGSAGRPRERGAVEELGRRTSHTEADDDGSRSHMIKEGNLRLAAAGVDGAEDIVEYDDDIQIAEAFRLAERERRLLRRLQQRQRAKEERKRNHHHQQQQQQRSGGSPSASAPPPAVGNRSGLLGATMEERFCTPLCLEAFQEELLPLVPRYMEYEHEELLEAVCSLFPRVPPDALRRLAGLEAGATAVLRDAVVERPSSGKCGSAGTGCPAPPPPVVAGASNESSATRNHLSGGGADTTEGAAQHDHRLVESMTAQMSRRDALWDGAVVYRLSRGAFRSASSGEPSAGREGEPKTQPTADRGRGKGEEEEEGPDNAEEALAVPIRRIPERPPLRGPLLVMDTLMTISSNTTKELFLLHGLLRRRRSTASSAAALAPSSPSVLERVMGPVREALAKRVDELQRAIDESDGGGRRTLSSLLRLENDLRVDPVTEQQRRELAFAQLFSADLASTLSRLAWVDISVILGMAWEGVWWKASSALLPERTDAWPPRPEGRSLAGSLSFPFALPSILARPVSAMGATASPELIALGLVMLLAAALCNDGVQAALAESADAVAEVLHAVGMTDGDTTAALRALVLSEEDS